MKYVDQVRVRLLSFLLFLSILMFGLMFPLLSVTLFNRPPNLCTAWDQARLAMATSVALDTSPRGERRSIAQRQIDPSLYDQCESSSRFDLHSESKYNFENVVIKTIEGAEGVEFLMTDVSWYN